MTSSPAVTTLVADGVLAAVPVFPLPDVVLFPGTVLPLHVFEERYRAMTIDVMAAHRHLVVARLKPGYEATYHGRPPVHAVAGVGQVVASERLGDGRWNIVLKGVARVRIEEELPADVPYRRVRATQIGEETPDAARLADGQAQLVSLCDHLALRLDAGGENLRELVRTDLGPAGVTDVLAGALVADPDDRQLLLEALDPTERQRLLIDHLAGLIRRFSPPSSLRN